MRSHTIRRYQRVLGLFIMALFAVNAVRASPPASGVSFSQIRYAGAAEYSHLAQMSVAPGALYGSGYLNVERYEQGRAVDWVVRNLPLNGDAVTAVFDLGSSGQQVQFAAYVDFSPAPLPDDSSLRNRTPFVYLLSYIELPPDNLNQFQDVVCYQNDKKFWTGQASVVAVQVLVDAKNFVTADATGWIVKGKDSSKTLLITASHNFTDNEVAKTAAYVNFQRPKCGSGLPTDSFFGDFDEVLERNPKLDFVIVSLKPPPEGKKYPAPLQPLYEEFKPGVVVSLPQQPSSYTGLKQGGFYYDIDNKKRCQLTTTPALNRRLGQIDAKCGAVQGTSGSPLLDAADTEGSPYAIALIVGCRETSPKNCKPLSAVGYKMSDVCDYDAGNDGKKLLDCKKP